MPPAIDAARRLISDRLREIEAEAKQLKRALKGMGTSASTVPKAPKRRRKRTTNKARQRRPQAPRGQRREQLLTAIKATPGARPYELAAEIGISPAQASTLLAKARAEKLVVKKGAGYELKE